MARERIDLAGVFPAVFEQSMKPVCVAAAVAGLVEFYEGFREPLSVEFLDDAMMRQRKAWAEENLARLRRGEDGDAIWEDLYRKQLLQVRFVGRKTAFDSPEAEHLIALFEANIRERLLDADGATIAGAFGVLRERGICAERLWPYASAPHSAFSTVPPDAEDDAMHRRFGARELYLLKTPGNVEEVKRILAGANGNRPMPVAAILETFGECADGVFAMPGADAAAQGRHAVLVTGFDADGFTFRNSWGAKWGRRGYG
ncbi:MAG: hypothetical protein IJ802_04555 [Kiritimatiellae bacterium]|nr:hypothetical protein [Kiritimatiellia bacterium]